jgi:hypothetical protein
MAKGTAIPTQRDLEARGKNITPQVRQAIAESGGQPGLLRDLATPPPTPIDYTPKQMTRATNTTENAAAKWANGFDRTSPAADVPAIVPGSPVPANVIQTARRMGIDTPPTKTAGQLADEIAAQRPVGVNRGSAGGGTSQKIPTAAEAAEYQQQVADIAAAKGGGAEPIIPGPRGPTEPSPYGYRGVPGGWQKITAEDLGIVPAEKAAGGLVVSRTAQDIADDMVAEGVTNPATLQHRARANGMAGGVEISDAEAQAALTQAQARAAGGGAPLDIAASNGGAPASSLADGVLAALTPEERAVAEPRLRAMIARYGDQPMTPQEFDARFGTTYRGYGRFGGAPDAAGFVSPNRRGVIYTTPNETIAAGAYGRPLGETGTPAKYSALHYPNDAKIADLNDPATARALLSEMVDRPHPTLGEYRFGRPEQQYMKGEGAFSGMSRERFDAIREEIANALDVSTGGAGQLELMDDPWAVDALRRLGFEGATNGKTTAFLDSSTLLPSWARNAYTEPRAGLPRAGGTPIPNAADLAAAEEEAFSRYQNQAENAAELGPEDELVTPEQQAYLDKQMGKQPGTPIPKAADLAAPARSTLREGNRDGELIRAYAEGRANPDRIIAQAQAQYADAVAMADIPAMQRVEERLLDHGQAAAVAKNTAAYDAYNAARLEMFGPQSATPEGRAAHWQAVQEQLDKTAAMMPGPRPELTKAGGPGPRQVTAAERGAIDRGMYDTATADHTAEYEAWQAREADRLAPYDPNAPSPTDIYGAGPPTEADIARLQANPLSPGRVEIPNISIDPRMRDLIAGRMTDEEAAAIRDRGLYGRAAGQQEAPFYREGVIPSIGREGLPPIGNEGLPLQLPQGDIPLQLPRGPLPRQIETLGPNVTRYSGDLADLAAGGGTMRPPLAGFSTAPETRLLPSGAPIPALHGPDFVPPLGRPFTDFTAGEAGTVRGLPIAPPRDVQALEAARGRAQAGIRDAAFARGTGDQAAVQAGLERGYRIVGNNADQTTAGMWMKNGVGGVTPPVLPFAPFHIHSAQFWSQYFAAHPALALGMAQVLQTFDDYGTLKFPEGNSLAGLIKTTTGLHILDWAQKAYEYATDVNRAGGNNIPQQILKNLNYNLTGNNAFVRPFEYISGPLASLTQRTTNPLLSGKLDYDTKQPLADSRDLLREYGAMNGTTGFGQRLNDLAGSPLPRNVVTGATNPGQALGNLLQRGTDTAFGVNRQEYNPDLAAAHALGFVADQMGLSKYQAERAYYSPQTPQDIALGKQLHDAVNVRLDTQAMGKLAPVQARGAQSAMEAKGIYQPNTEKAYMLDMPIGTGGFTGKDLLNQPGNYYNTLDKITAAKAQYGDNSPQVKALQGELAKIRATDVAQAPGPLGQYFDALHKQDLATYGDQTFRGKLNPQEQNAYDAFNNLKASADYKARTALEQQAAEANKGKDAPKGSAEHNAYTDFYKRNGDELTRLNNIVNGAEQSIVDRFGVNPKELSNRAAVAAGYAPSYADTTIGGQKPIGGVPSTSNNSNANTSNARSTSSNIRASGTSSRTSSRGGTSSSTGGTAAATRQAGNDFFDLYKSVTDKGEKAAVLRAFDKAGITPFDKGTTAQEYRAALTVAQEALRTKRAADLIDAAGSRQRAAGSTQQGGTRALSLAELSQLMERTTGIGPAAADRGMLGGGYSASSATPRTFSLPNPGSATGSTKAPAGYYYDKSGRLQKSKFAA